MKNDSVSLEIRSLSAIEHILTHHPERVQKLRVYSAGRPNERLQSLVDRAQSKKIKLEISEPGQRTQDPAVAFLHPFVYTDLKQFLASLENRKPEIVLALDHLQDPQNFGALCRSAEALGVAGILIPKDRGVSVTEGVYSASVGAVESIPVILVANLAEALRKFKEKEFWIVGTSLGENSKPLYDTPTFEKIVLVLGTELEGISQNVEKTCDWLVQLPLKGKVQSLNVSSAGAIFLHYFLTRP